MPGLSHARPNGRTVVSSRDMSLAYVTMQAWTTGSSGSVPSARSHTRWPSDGTPLRLIGSPSM